MYRIPERGESEVNLLTVIARDWFSSSSIKECLEIGVYFFDCYGNGVFINWLPLNCFICHKMNFKPPKINANPLFIKLNLVVMNILGL